MNRFVDLSSSLSRESRRNLFPPEDQPELGEEGGELNLDSPQVPTTRLRLGSLLRWLRCHTRGNGSGVLKAMLRSGAKVKSARPSAERAWAGTEPDGSTPLDMGRDGSAKV